MTLGNEPLADLVGDVGLRPADEAPAGDLRNDPIGCLGGEPEQRDLVVVLRDPERSERQGGRLEAGSRQRSLQLEEVERPEPIRHAEAEGAGAGPVMDDRGDERVRIVGLLPGHSRDVSAAAGACGGLLQPRDDEEVGLLRLAAEAADRVVAQLAAGPLVGRTEADVAHEVRERLIAEGHEEALFAIVGSGPNSASPHHEASERVIEAGEPIVLDIGGTLGGYGSDITRTLWVTGGDDAKGPDEEFRHLFNVLRAAQEKATGAVRPGVVCEAIDATARRLIDAEGYGDAFFHRTGHGIGLEGHEDPYLVAGNRETLAEGMAFSVEPGIYLTGQYGARIEDIVVCGPDGPIALNQAPRELHVVEG